MTVRLTKQCLLMALLPTLTGCGDPFERPGTLHATGINQANFETMVVNKADLVVGHQAPGSDATLDAAAAERLHADHLKPLPVVGTSSLSTGQ